MYFGAGLRGLLKDDTRPIGLVHTAWGGSMIEQWLTNEAGPVPAPAPAALASGEVW